MLLCGQLALAVTLMQTANPEAAITVQAPARGTAGAPIRLRRHAHDNSMFLDGEYLIRGVAGAVLWKIAREYVSGGRVEFTNRELRTAPELKLPDFQDNLEVRLVLLQRRLAEHHAPIQMERVARGRLRLSVRRPIVMEE